MKETDLWCERCERTVWVHEVRPLTVKCDGDNLSPNLNTAAMVVFVYDALGKRKPPGLIDRHNRELANGR